MKRRREPPIQAEKIPFQERTHPEYVLIPQPSPLRHLKRNQFEVYMTLLQLIDMTYTPDGLLVGWTIPLTLTHLAQEVGWTVRTVKGHLKVLIESGWVEWDTSGGWRVDESHRYRIAKWAPISREALAEELGGDPFLSARLTTEK